MRVGFATDIHLDADPLQGGAGYPQQRLAGSTIAHGQDALVIGGDISSGGKFKDQFHAFCKGAGIPVYFVLGNHDFWNAPEDEVRETAASFPGYLDRGTVVELTSRVALVGRSGWYDTLSGDPFSHPSPSNDSERIPRLAETCWGPPHMLLKECLKWSEREAEAAVPVLEQAAARYPEVWFVTHFPCFRSACWAPDGSLDAEWRGWWPWSINTTMGVALRDVAERFPQTKFTVLSGHTHGGGSADLTANLSCVSGWAEWGAPRLSHSWDLRPDPVP